VTATKHAEKAALQVKEKKLTEDTKVEDTDKRRTMTTRTRRT
jgi:hypothetical protein